MTTTVLTPAANPTTVVAGASQQVHIDAVQATPTLVSVEDVIVYAQTFMPGDTTVLPGDDLHVQVNTSLPLSTLVAVTDQQAVTIAAQPDIPTTVTTLPLVPVTISVDQMSNTVVIGTSAEQGPRGAPGTAPTYPVGTSPVSGHKVVKLNGDGSLGYADCTAPTDAFTILGMTDQAYSAGQNAVVRTTGTITHVGWSWVPGQSVIVGTNGDLTQVLPVGAVFVRHVAIALTATTIALNFLSPAINI